MKWYHWLGLGGIVYLLWKSSSKASAAEAPQDNIVPLSPPAVIDAATQIAVDTIKANPDVPPGAVIAAVADATAEVTALPSEFITSGGPVALCYKPTNLGLTETDPAVRIGLLEKQLAAGRVSAATAQRIRGAFGLGGEAEDRAAVDKRVNRMTAADRARRKGDIERQGLTMTWPYSYEYGLVGGVVQHTAPVTSSVRIPVTPPAPAGPSTTDTWLTDEAKRMADKRAAEQAERDRLFKELLDQQKADAKKAKADKVAAAMAAAARNVSFAVVRPVWVTAITRR